MQDDEDFQDVFPTHLSMSILDEAAATAETYVPLVIRSWVSAIVSTCVNLIKHPPKALFSLVFS